MGITESRRLVAECVLRREDMHTRFDDAVGITGHWTQYGACYAIPYRSLTDARGREPAGRGSLHLGRLSRTPRDERDSGLRVTGRVTGSAAAWAVAGSIGPRQLDARCLAPGGRNPVAAVPMRSW
jgi:hypothetical protein